MKRLWAGCLIVIGLNTLILALPNLFGQSASDAITLAVGAIDLIACPILIYATVKLYMQQ